MNEKNLIPYITIFLRKWQILLQKYNSNQMVNLLKFNIIISSSDCCRVTSLMGFYYSNAVM
jgi:hypothetical protein